jgi:hypothetical protein
MNTNIDIEHIFLHKDYHELSADEKLAIKDIAENEVTFNDTKLMMSSIQNYLNDIPEISPKKESKEQLLATFKKVRPAATEKTVGLGFLFPKDKAFFQKPGFQMLAAAAVIVFIITIFNWNIFTKPENEMAQNKVTEETKASKPQRFATKEKEEESSNENLINTTVSEDIEENSQLNQNLKIEEQNTTSTENKVATGTVYPISDILYKSESKKNELPTEVPEIKINRVIAKDIVLESDQMDDHLAIQETTTLNNFSNVPSANTMAMADEMASKSTFDKNANKKRDASSSLAAPKLSKTLSENAELINLFYTAM